MMENAGRSLAGIAREMLGGSVAGHAVLVLAGKGNNGGGGMAAARHLANAGARVEVLLASTDLSDAAEHQRRALARMGVRGAEGARPLVEVDALIPKHDLVIDALIGYSLHGAPKEPIASFIRSANAAGIPRLSKSMKVRADGTSYERLVVV